MKFLPHTVIAAGFVAVSLTLSGPAWSYGWLSHWRILDDNWETLSKDLCKSVGGTARPDLTRKEYEQDRIANAAALGAVISDLSYVLPRTPRQFSDLLHYVGTGRFADELTRTACGQTGGDRDMLAFAVGFRSHYWADRVGHHYGTNVIVADLIKAGRSNSAPVHLTGIPRLVYERETSTHRMVEIDVLSRVDLSLSLVNATVAFISAYDDYRDTIRKVEKLLRDSADTFYGKSAREFLPDAERILEFARRATAATCLVIDTVYGETPPTGERDKPLRDRCEQRLKSVETKDPETASIYQKRRSTISTNMALVKQYPRIAVIYGQSLSTAKRAIADHAGALPDYNLDTNLPTAGGQSRLSDRAYCKLVSTWGKSCDAGSVFSISEKVQFDWKRYLDEGLRARNLMSQQATAGTCTALLHESEIKSVVERWKVPLDVGATSPPSSQDCKNAGAFKMLNKTFRLDAKCDGVTAGKDMRNVDMLYGCRVAQEFKRAMTNPKPAALQTLARQIEPEYIEGLEKFRLSAEEIGYIDGSTSLYKQP